MHASQLSVSLLQFTNPFGILTILAFSLFVNNSEKIELWVPLMGPLLRYLGPLLVPFLLKVGSPLGPLFRIFGSPFDCVTVQIYFITKQTYVVITRFFWDMGYVTFVRIFLRIRAVLVFFVQTFRI